MTQGSAAEFACDGEMRAGGEPPEQDMGIRLSSLANFHVQARRAHNNARETTALVQIRAGAAVAQPPCRVRRRVRVRCPDFRCIVQGPVCERTRVGCWWSSIHGTRSGGEDDSMWEVDIMSL